MVNRYKQILVTFDLEEDEKEAFVKVKETMDEMLRRIDNLKMTSGDSSRITDLCRNLVDLEKPFSELCSRLNVNSDD